MFVIVYIVDVYYRCYMTLRVKVIYCGAPYLSKNETYIYRTLLQRFKEEKFAKRKTISNMWIYTND